MHKSRKLKVALAVITVLLSIGIGLSSAEVVNDQEKILITTSDMVLKHQIETYISPISGQAYTISKQLPIEKTWYKTNDGLLLKSKQQLLQHEHITYYHQLSKLDTNLQQKVTQFKDGLRSGSEMVSVLIELREQPLYDVSRELRNEYAPVFHSLRSTIEPILEKTTPQRYATKDEFLSNPTLIIEQIQSSLTPEDKELWQDTMLEFDRMQDTMRKDILNDARTIAFASQASLLQDIAQHDGFVSYRGAILNVLGVQVPLEYVALLLDDPQVVFVGECGTLSSTLDMSAFSIYADTWWDAGEDGGVWDAAVVDTGVDGTHPALVVDMAETFHDQGQYHGDYDDDPLSTDDFYGHGTHCAGIVASEDATYRGIAHGLDMLINAKAGWIATDERGHMIWTDAMEAIDWAIGTGGADVISFSFAGGIDGDGNNQFTRFMDAVVDGLYVTIVNSCGNEGPDPHTIRLPSDGFNLIAVGAIDDQGTTGRGDDVIADFSSRGPTADGRIKPDLVAPGEDSSDALDKGIKSCNFDWEGGGGSDPDFVRLRGTSMACPHISGAVLLLMDYLNIPEPMLYKALLLNTASDYGTGGPDTSYGWGYVNLHRAWYDRDYVYTGTVDDDDPDYQFYSGSSLNDERATLVWNRNIVYSGPSYPSDPGYTINDLDLYTYDQQTNMPLEYAISSINNVEQVQFTRDTSNTILKIDVFGAFEGVSQEEFALATEQEFIARDGPQLNINIDHPAEVPPDTTFEVFVNITNSGDLTAHGVETTLEMSPEFSLVYGLNPQYIGSIPDGNQKQAYWILQSSSTLGEYSLSANATSLSYEEIFTTQGSSTIQIALDVTPPPAPQISSPTHPDEDEWYHHNNPEFFWSTPSDLSGIAGYSYTFDDHPTTTPDTTLDTRENTHSYEDITAGTWYFHTRAQDNAGNWGDTDHYRIQIAADHFPQADFSYSPIHPSYTDRIFFIDNSSDLDGTITDWWWDFGNHYYSDLPNPTHCYYENGTFQVRLTVTDNDNYTDTMLQTIEVGSHITMVYVNDDYTEVTPGWGVDHFACIQDGIDAVAEDGTVFVLNGIYYETLDIAKSITLTGTHDETTIIDGLGQSNVVAITADGIEMRGFTIQNSTGIGIDIQSNFNTLSNNIYVDNYIGIQLGTYYTSYHHNSITDNSIYSNDYGISIGRLWDANNNIARNTIAENWIGVLFWPSSLSITDDGQNILSENTFMSNKMYGVFIGSTSNNTFIDNVFLHDGFYLDKPHHNTFIDNTVNGKPVIYREGISGQTLTASGGQLLLVSCDNMTIQNQLLSNTTVGIQLLDSEHCLVSDNILRDNQKGMYILEDSNDNDIYHNIFRNNSQHAYDECANSWDDGYPSGGNYWDDYSGTDGNGDKIGDSAYVIPGGINQDNYPFVEPYGWILGDPPVADFYYDPTNPTTDDLIDFFSTSYDPDGVIVNWTWDFDDDAFAYGEIVSHQYYVEGTYQVMLSVTDDMNNTNTTTREITVIVLTERLDQEQTDYSSSTAVYQTRWCAQSFIPSLDILTRGDLYLRKSGSPSGDLIIAIRDSLTGSDLSAISLPVESIPTSFTWVDCDFSDVAVTPGSTYYIVARTSGGSSSDSYLWGYGYDTPYTDGSLWFSFNSGSSWIRYAAFDFCFKTYGDSGGPPIPVLSFNPSAYDFGDMLEGEIGSTMFNIWNSGQGVLTYDLSETCDWVTVDPTGGSSAGEHDSITIDIDTTGLPLGVHQCAIDIDSNGGTGVFTLSVTIIEPTPVLSFNPSSYNFGSMYEGETDSTSFDIWNSGTGVLFFNLSENCTWITVDPTEGSSTGEHDSILVEINTAGLALGSYQCDITIDSNGGSGDFTVYMTLTSAVETLDQQQSDYSSSAYVYGSRWSAQSYIPTMGVLTRVELYMSTVGSPSNDLVVSIRESLTGSELTTVSIPASAIPSSFDWVECDFTDIVVSPGNTYYIVVRTSSGGSSNSYTWGYGFDTAYTDGMMHYSYNGGSAWNDYTQFDYCFKTYGVP